MKDVLEIKGEVILTQTSPKEIKKGFGKMYTSMDVSGEVYEKKYRKAIANLFFNGLTSKPKENKLYNKTAYILKVMSLKKMDSITNKNPIFGTKSGSIQYKIKKDKTRKNTYIVSLSGIVLEKNGTDFIEWLVPILQKYSVLEGNVTTTDYEQGIMNYVIDCGCNNVKVSTIKTEFIKSIAVPKPKFKIA